MLPISRQQPSRARTLEALSLRSSSGRSARVGWSFVLRIIGRGYAAVSVVWRRSSASMPGLRLCYGLSDFAATVGALIDEVDLRHVPMRFDVPDIHREKSQATGADDRTSLKFVMMHVGRHAALLHSGNAVDFTVELITAFDGCPSINF
jgi:hypothetical protein